MTSASVAASCAGEGGWVMFMGTGGRFSGSIFLWPGEDEEPGPVSWARLGQADCTVSHARPSPTAGAFTFSFADIIWGDTTGTF